MVALKGKSDIGDQINKKIIAPLAIANQQLSQSDFDHLRTSNPIESVFATVRHRTVRTKGALSAKTAKLMVFKLVNAAAKTWQRLKDMCKGRQTTSFARATNLRARLNLRGLSPQRAVTRPWLLRSELRHR